MFSESVYKTCQDNLQNWNLANCPFKVPQNMQIWKPRDKKWRYNDIITKNNGKTMGKCGHQRNQTNYTSVERYWWELSKNVLFIEFKPPCQKLWAFLSNFGIFYDAGSPNMVMSRDPRSKFQNFFIFFLILHFTAGKVTKFLVEKLSTSEVSSQKPHGGMENTPPPSAFRVNWRSSLYFKMSVKNTELDLCP